MVVTDLPSTLTASSVQLFIETPSIWTTQAPHCEVSQPTWVPVRLRFSRRKSDRSKDAGVSAFTFFPLTVISTFMRVSPVAFFDWQSGSSEHPGLVFFPSGDHHVSHGERVAIEHTIRHIGDQLVVA